MKRKIFFYLTIIAIAVITAIGLTHCIKPKQECEINNTGSVEIISEYPTAIIVYIDAGGYTTNSTTLYTNESVTYTGVSAGDIVIWEWDADSGWGYWNRACVQCETYTFTIYQISGKAGNGNLSKVNKIFINK